MGTEEEKRDFERWIECEHEDFKELNVSHTSIFEELPWSGWFEPKITDQQSFFQDILPKNKVTENEIEQTRIWEGKISLDII